MAWWKKALKIGGAAANGYSNPGMDGVGAVAGSLLAKKKKKKLGATGADAAEDVDLPPSAKYPSYWEDEKREDW